MKKYFCALLTYAAIGIAILFFLVPMIWTISTSFKRPRDYYVTKVNIFPPRPTISHYLSVLGIGTEAKAGESKGGVSSFMDHAAPGGLPPIKSSIFNSLIVVGSSVLIAFMLGMPAAYALSRLKSKASNNLLLTFLSLRMLPPISVIIPFFFIINAFGLIDTYPGLIMPYVLFNLPFVVWIMKGTFDKVPVVLEEAAMVGGCNYRQMWTRITLPLSMGGAVATALFCFLITWSEFLFALVLTRNNTRTLPVAVTFFVTQHRGILWGPMSATIVISVLPILALVFILQQTLVRAFMPGEYK